MSRLRILLAAGAMALAVVPARVPSALADAPASNPSPQQQLASLNAQLDAAKAQLDQLNNQIEHNQSQLDLLNNRLTDDQSREAKLNDQLTMLGRMEYEQPVLSLSTILQAGSVQELFTNIAQARLIATKQRNLLNQTRQLKRQDQQAHDQVAATLASVQTARDAAAQVAAKALAMRNSVQDATFQARVTAVGAQATVTVAPGRAPTSGPFPNRFTFGYCTWYVATRRNIPWLGNAIEWWANARPYGFAEGSTPRVGAIMVSRESSLGHVAYVESVNGNQFTVSEMNWTAWDVVDRRTITLGGSVPIVGFIY